MFKRWCSELSEFSEQQLFDGLQKFKQSGSTYMSLNIFRNHCKPKAQDLGLMSFEQAHPLICKREWEKLHPAFQHVARQYDLYNISRMSSENSAKALLPLFADVVDRLARGESFERLEGVSHNPSGVTHIGEADRKKGREVLSALLKDLK